MIEGIYARLAENIEKEPDVDSFITFNEKLPPLLIRREWFELKNIILTERLDKQHKTIFLRGTAGRGKTSFVFYLMYCMLYAAKNKAKKEESSNTSTSRKRKLEDDDCVIGYVKNIDNKEVNLVLTLDNKYITVDSISENSVCYYIADVRDDKTRMIVGQHFTMVVSSDDASKKAFGNKVMEAGGVNNSGYVYGMPSPTREQLIKIFAKNPEELPEVEFHLDVVGCNPRALAVSSDNIGPIYKPEYSGVVQAIESLCSELLKCGNDEVGTRRIRWVTVVVLWFLHRATAVTATSLFKEYEITNNFVDFDQVFSSTFMCFLAGKIDDMLRGKRDNILKMFFGCSGVGNSFEYDSHNFFAGLTSPGHPCCRSTGKWELLQLGGTSPRTKVIFRNINSIAAKIDESKDFGRRYLMPSVCNLALIDSVIPDNTVLQMTISKKDSGAIDRMNAIRQELGNPTAVIMIFVVPVDTVQDFSFPVEFAQPEYQYVHMYVTAPKIMTIGEARILRQDK
jgi:hypothetical protein